MVWHHYELDYWYPGKAKAKVAWLPSSSDLSSKGEVVASERVTGNGNNNNG